MLDAKNAPMLITVEAMMSGAIILVMEMPAAFAAMSSLFSAIWPIVIMAARSVASGRASGRIVQLPHSRNSPTTFMLSPLPTSSSM